MFVLSLLEHTLRLPPESLELPLKEGIQRELEKLFLDKVIANLGLCISIYDIRFIDGGFIFPGEGAPTYTVKFRLIMFRPFPGEILSAKLKESDSSGVRLSLGFFDDIYIPAHLLPTPHHFELNAENDNYRRWVWKFNDKDLAIDETCEIRFQVHAVNFTAMPIEQPKESKPFAPMVITGSIDYDGLGPLLWWGGGEEEEDMEGGS